MNKKELIKAIADRTGMSFKDTEKTIDGFVDVATGNLRAGKEVKLPGFGNFQVVQRAARQARNPYTGGMISVAAKKAMKFKASKHLKDLINS